MISISEAREKNTAVEREILALLQQLERETGTVVLKVVFERGGIARGFETPPISKLQVICVV